MRRKTSSRATSQSGIRTWSSSQRRPAHQPFFTEITLDHLRPSPKWEKQMADLQLAKEVEAVIRKWLKMQKQQKIQEELKLEMLKKAAIEYGWIPDSNKPF